MPAAGGGLAPPAWLPVADPSAVPDPGGPTGGKVGSVISPVMPSTTGFCSAEGPDMMLKARVKIKDEKKFSKYELTSSESGTGCK